MDDYQDYDDYPMPEPTFQGSRRSSYSKPVMIASLAAGLFVLLFLYCLSPSTELIHMTDNAIEMARDAQDQVVTVSIWSGIFRLLAVVIGVSIPLVVCWKIWQSTDSGEIEADEVLRVLEDHHGRLDSLPKSETRKALPNEPTSAPGQDPARNENQRFE